MLRKIKHFKNSSGQALVTLLFFVIIGVTIISAQAIVLYTNVLAASTVERGIDAYYIAESGAEEAILRILRDPSYSGGQISIDGGTATIEVDSGVIISTGAHNNSVRKIKVETATNNGVLTIDSWEEI